MREQVQHEVGRAAAGGAGRDGVLERLARQDAARARGPVLQQAHDELAGIDAGLVLAAVEGGRARGAERGEAQELEGHRHRVGGELAAAGAGAGAGVLLELEQVLVGHLARGVGADALEDVLDRDVAALEASRAMEPE